MTERHPVLTGLDDVDWAALSHAYGPALDTPDLLRRLAAVVDEGDEEEILEELWSSLCHQGSVYPATVAAIPFLAEIAACGVATTGTLHLLGAIAEAADPRAVGDADRAGDADPVRAAVAACFDVLAPLIDDPDEDVRGAVIFALAHSGLCDTRERVRTLLVSQWTQRSPDADSVLRAELLHALIRVDPVLAADLADEVLTAADASGSGSDPAGGELLRVSAALAWIQSGRALDERVLVAALTPIPGDGPDLSQWCPDGELFDLVVRETAEKHGPRTAAGLLARALTEAAAIDEGASHAGADRSGGARFSPLHPGADRSGASHYGSAGLVEERLDAARSLILDYRGVAEPLIGPITNLLGRTELNGPVFGLLATIGPDAFSPAVRDRLIPLSQAVGDAFADDTLTYLFTWGEPSAPDLLARDLADRPRTLSAVSGALARLEPGSVSVPFNANLLAAIRRRLAELADAASAGAPEDEDVFTSMRRTNEPIQLARILGAWGEAAAPAVPELARLLPISTIPAARALAAIHPHTSPTVRGPRSVGGFEAAEAALRAIVGRGGTSERIAVAKAIRVLTEDSGPLLDVVLDSLDLFDGAGSLADRGDELRAVAEAAANLPEHAATLVPRLTAALLGGPAPGLSLPAHGARLRLVSTLWLLTGESSHAIPVLRESLTLTGEIFTSWTVADAADVAAMLGADARDLLPELESALDDPVACPAAAEALLAIDPEGERAADKRERLALQLVSTLTNSRAARAQQRALDVLAALAADHLPSAAVDVLRELADREERILAALPDAELVRSDASIRARIRALLARSR